MKLKPFTVELVCLFCGAPLEGKEGITYASGDLIRCSECGEDNDYDSVLNVAKEKGVGKLKKEAEKQIKDEFKKLFKKF